MSLEALLGKSLSPVTGGPKKRGGRRVCFFPFSFILSFKGVRYGKGYGDSCRRKCLSTGDRDCTVSNLTSVTMNLKGCWVSQISCFEQRSTGRGWQGVTLLEGHCSCCFGVLPSGSFSKFTNRGKGCFKFSVQQKQKRFIEKCFLGKAKTRNQESAHCRAPVA